MSKKMLSVAETAARIEAGARLAIAGDEALLRALPPGTWIGGTIPYFMSEDGGQCTTEALYVDELPQSEGALRIAAYGPDELAHIPRDAYERGYSLIILPAATPVHERFAKEAPEYEGMFLHPLVGWVAGVKLDDIGRVTPKVFEGPTGAVHEDAAVVLHVELPPAQTAIVDIVNVFEQGQGDTLTFDATGFQPEMVRVNGGEPQSFAAYLRAQGVDTRLPLVADYAGAMVNVSLQSVPEGDGAVALYAPVFEGVEYRFAQPVADYVETFTAAIPGTVPGVRFSCNCILNYVYSGLEGRRTGTLTGPMTFGEIAYQLLNQTMVYLRVE